MRVVKVAWPVVESLVKMVVPPLSEAGHKGTMGRIGVIGGSADYCGAPYYAAVSALKMGADLSWVYCSEKGSIPIKSYSPELMATPFYSEDSLFPLADDLKQKVQPKSRPSTYANDCNYLVSLDPRVRKQGGGFVS